MNKKLAALLIPLMLLAVAGFGYAQFTSTITESISATAGTLNIDFTGVPSISLSSVYMTGTAVITTPDLLTVTVSNFAPGDYATVTFNITNLGLLPGSLSQEVVGAVAPFVYSDDLPSTIGVGATITVTATITLPSGTGNVYQGAIVTFTVTITATAGA